MDKTRLVVVAAVAHGVGPGSYGIASEASGSSAERPDENAAARST